jgi:hypothetical protein
VARIESPAGQPTKQIRFGTGAASLTIIGDIVQPISDISDWEAARDPDNEEK